MYKVYMYDFINELNLFKINTGGVYEQLCSSLLHDAATVLQIDKSFALNASKSFY